MFEARCLRDGMRKGELVRELCELTGLHRSDVVDVLNALTDVAQREMLVTGAFSLPGVFNVTRKVRKGTYRYFGDIDKTLLYPSVPYLSARVSKPVRELHKDLFKAQLMELNGVDGGEWWLPYVVGDGNLLKGGGVAGCELKSS